MEISEGQNKAAGLVVELIADKMGNKRQVHPGTAISSAARLAGSFMFRSFDLKLSNVSPGSPVLSEQANEKGPILINILAGTLKNFDVNLDADKMKSTSNAASNVSFLETLERLQDQAQIIMSQNHLSLEQMAYSCVIATSFIITECRNDLPCETGFHTAVYGFIEGSKTYPPKFGASKKKSLFKFWK